MADSCKGWRVLILLEIANFSTLRRHLGKARGDLLTNDVKVRIGTLLQGALLTAPGRAAVEADWCCPSLDALQVAIGRVEKAFSEPLDIDGEPHSVELSVAAAAAPVRDADDIRLAEEVEAALAQARAEHRSIIRDVSATRPMLDNVALSHELADAIASDQVFLQYQPKVNVRRQEVAGAEALVRWNHPERGRIFPGDFIPLAEKSHQIGALTLWTLRRAIADQQLLKADGSDFPIYINISGQLLSDDDFVQTACSLIANSGAKIGFEITETSVIHDPDSAIANLKAIAAQGVSISIDDYGAGLSSLAYLKKLPARELKIDKMFVLELTRSNRDPLIVRSTIDLAHALEMEVTAEGVETPAALALLAVMGCDLVQGFLISRPLSLPAFRHFLLHEVAQVLAEASTYKLPFFGRVA